jgi:tetratricopeptide (TPR) repeat protein
MTTRRPALDPQETDTTNRKSSAREAFGAGNTPDNREKLFAFGQKTSNGKLGNAKAKSRWKEGGLKAANFAFSKRAENTTDPDVLRGAGMTSFKTNNFNQARKYLQQLVDKTEDEWVTITATNGKKRKDYIDAQLLRALALSHYNVAAKNALIEDFDHNINFPIFEAAQKVFSPALRHVENAADPDLLLQAGKCYEGLADWNGALTIFGSIIAGFPRYEKMTSVVIRAVALLAQTGQMPTAVAYCERILDLPPPGFTQDDMMFILARTYELAGRNAEAQDTFKEVHRLYNKRLNMLKQRGHQRIQKGLKPIDPLDDLELHAWLKQDKEGPTLDCANYGEFRSWRTWYDNPETWRRRMKRFNNTLDLPIFAADANVEVLRREQQIGVATSATWLSLSYIKHRMRDPAVSLQAALKALELDKYDKDIRQLVVKKDPAGWGERFKLEEERAIDIQRVLSRGARGRWRAFVKRNEVAMMNHSATVVQKLRRGQLGRRKILRIKKEIHSSILIQTRVRIYLAKKKVQKVRTKHIAAKKIQRQLRLQIKKTHSAIKIQKITRGMLGKSKAVHRQKCIYGAMKMQSLFRSYKWRKIAREIRIARDAAVDIERVFRGFVARTFFRYRLSRFVGARGLQRIGRGWRVRRRIRNLKSTSAIQIQKLIRGHFGRNRVANLRSAVRKHLLHTPVVQLMRAASVAPDCSWLSQGVFKDIHLLNDAFSSETVVSETSSLTTKDTKRIGAMLYKNNMVKTLILSSGSMGDDGAIGLASALHYNTSLNTLAIGPNNVGSSGAAALASTLKNHNYSLRHLCFDYNPLNAEGANSILGACSDFFCRNYGNLQRLTLSACGVSDENASLLGDLLYMNRRLMYLDLSGNKIADIAVKEISQALCNNSTLVGLDLRGNMVRSDGAHELAACLLRNNILSGKDSLEKVESENGNEIEEKGVGNDTLQILRLDCNIILDDGALNLMNSFKLSGSLRALTMEGNPIGNNLIENFNYVGRTRVEGFEDPLSPIPESDGRTVVSTVTKRMPKFKLSPVRNRGRQIHGNTKPTIPTHHSNGTKFESLLREPVGRASFQIDTPERNQGPLSLDSIIPVEMRHAYVGLDKTSDSLSSPLLPVAKAPVTYPSPSVPNRLYRRRKSPVRLAPRHTAKPLPNVFLSLVSPPAMHVNPIHSIDNHLIERTSGRHISTRSGIKSQPRNIYGGPSW